MPDIVIWMISGSSRIAYHRIPANEVLFSPNADSKGRNCAKIQTFELKVSHVFTKPFTLQFLNFYVVKVAGNPVNVNFMLCFGCLMR